MMEKNIKNKIEKIKNKFKKRKQSKLSKIPLVEDLYNGKKWEDLYKLIEKNRKSWNKGKLSEEEKRIIRKIVNEWIEEYKKNDKNLLIFGDELEKNKRALWEEFLLVLRYYPK